MPSILLFCLMKKRKKTIIMVLCASALFTLSGMMFHATKSMASQVIAGSNGWLFYKAIGDGSTLSDYGGTNHYSAQGLQRVKNNIMAAKDAVEAKGARFIVMIAPNKESIYSKYMPKQYKRKTTYTRGDQLYDYLEANTALDVCYPKQTLLKYKDKYELYYPTDTHWNRQGQFIGLQDLMDITDGRSIPISSVKFTKKRNYYGDLCTLSYGAHKYYCNQYTLKTKVKKTEKSSQKVFVVGDSFGRRLCHIAKKYYKKARFCHINDFHFNKIKKGEVVVWEAVERYQDRFVRINFANK